MKNKPLTQKKLSDEDIRTFLWMLILEHASTQNHSLNENGHDEIVKKELDAKLRKLIQEKLEHDDIFIYHSEKECAESEEDEAPKLLKQPLLTMILVRNEDTGNIVTL